MGLIRRSILDRLGGWDEWCITEDAEASLRMLKAGYSGLYVGRSFGRGIMPLTFASLKSQRFRWCFGGMQILRMHWRDLIAWNRDPANRLSVGQRIDYLLGSLQWLNDLVQLGFTLTLLASAVVLLTRGWFALRPLLGMSILLPAALIGGGLLRAVWALRLRARIGARRAALALGNWLSLSWTVSLACVQGLIRRRGAFLRTPKVGERRSLVQALWAARTETVLAFSLWAAGLWLALQGAATVFLVALFVWQGAVYGSAPFMSWLNQRTELSAQLERRRRSEWRRERLAKVGVPLFAGAAGLAAIALVTAVLAYGGAHPGPRAEDPLSLPAASSDTGTPIGNLFGLPSPSVTPSLAPSVSPSPTLTPTPSASPSPTPTPTPPASVSPTSSASPSPSTSVSPTPAAAASP
jgi:hypothetical protein